MKSHAHHTRIPVLAGVWFVLLAGSVTADDDVLWSQELAELSELSRDAPDAIELLQFGERAMAEGDYASAATRFAEARGFAPRAALPARRHCQALIALEQRHDALRACGDALDKGGTEEDQRQLAAVLASGTSSTGRFALGLIAPIALSLTAAAALLALHLRRVRRTSRLLLSGVAI